MIDEGTGHLSILLDNGMPCNDGKANYSTRFDFFCNDGEPDKVEIFLYIGSALWLRNSMKLFTI